MCNEMRKEVRRLLDELKMTQAEVVRRINTTCAYTVSRSEFNTYLKGLNSPKGNAVLMDALKVLIKEQSEREHLLQQAKSV